MKGRTSMNYLINKIDKEELADFLLNPYLKSARLGGGILQKYPKDHLNDDVYMIGDTSLVFYCRVNYDKKEIVEDKPFDHGQSPLFVSLSSIKDELKAKMKADLEDMKVSRAAEVKASEQYMELVEKYREKHLQIKIFELLGAKVQLPAIEDKSLVFISRFVDWLNLDEICNIRYYNSELLKIEEERIFMSDNFLISRFLFEEIDDEAKKIVDSGVLTERQKHLQNIVNKLKECDYNNVIVKTVEGLRLSCGRFVHTDGSVFINCLTTIEHFDFEEINKVISRGKVIYEKGVF